MTPRRPTFWLLVLATGLLSAGVCLADQKGLENLQNACPSIRCAEAYTLSFVKDAQAVEPLIANLAHPAWQVRCRTAQALAFQEDKRAVGPLIRCLGDVDRSVRGMAAEALGRLGDAQAVDALAKLLQDGDRDVRLAAAIALAQLGDARGLNLLIAGMGHPYWGWSAGQAAGKLADAKTGQALTAALKSPDAAVRQQAATALGLRKDPAAIEPLIALLDDPAEYVRRDAVEALGSMKAPQAGRPLRKMLKDPAWFVRTEAAESLVAVKDPQAAAAIGAILKDDPKIASQLAETLGKSGDRAAVGPLLEILPQSEPHVQGSILSALGKLKDKRAFDAAVQGLGSSDLWTVNAAAAALGELGDPRAVDILIQRLQEPRWHGEAGAATALGLLGDTRAVDALKPLLQNQWHLARPEAAKALRRLGYQPATPREHAILLTAAKDYDGLAKLGAPGAEALIGMFEDPYVDRGRIQEALISMKDQAVPAVARQLDLREPENSSRSCGSYCVNVLGEIGGEQVVPPLTRALIHPDNPLQAQVCEVLGRLKARQAIPDLVKVTARKVHADDYEGHWPRAAALKALGELGDAQALRAVRGALADPAGSVSAAAAEALARLDGVVALEVLPPLLRDPRTIVRQTAARALAGLQYRPREPAELVEMVLAAPNANGRELRSARAEALKSLLALLAEYDKEEQELGTDERIPHLDAGRFRVARLLGQLGDAQGVQPLSKLLKDPAWDVRAAAAEALGEIGGKEALAALRAYLPDWHARDAFGAALTRLKWQPMGMPDQLYLWTCTRDTAKILEHWDAALPHLRRSLASDRYQTVFWVVATLLSSGKPQAADEIKAELKRQNKPLLAGALLYCGDVSLQAEAENWMFKHDRPFIRPECDQAMPIWGRW